MPHHGCQSVEDRVIGSLIDSIRTVNLQCTIDRWPTEQHPARYLVRIETRAGVAEELETEIGQIEIEFNPKGFTVTPTQNLLRLLPHDYTECGRSQTLLSTEDRAAFLDEARRMMEDLSEGALPLAGPWEY